MKKLITASIVLHVVTMVMTAASYLCFGIGLQSQEDRLSFPTPLMAVLAAAGAVYIADIVLLALTGRRGNVTERKTGDLYASLLADAAIALCVMPLSRLDTAAIYALVGVTTAAILATAVLRCVCAAEFKRSIAAPHGAPVLPAGEKQLALVTACMGLIAILLGVAFLCVLFLYSYPSMFLPVDQEPTIGRTDGDPWGSFLAFLVFFGGVPTLLIMLSMSISFAYFLRRAGNGNTQLGLSVAATCMNAFLLFNGAYLLLLNPTHILLYVVGVLYFASSVAACVLGIMCGARIKAPKKIAPPPVFPELQ